MSSKLREALKGTVAILEEIRDAFKNGTGGPRMWEVNDVISEAKSSLAEPVRNIEMPDVDKRFAQFCDLHSTLGEDLKKHCQSCQLWEIRKLGHNCALFWAQMPYKQMPYKESKSET